MKCKYLLGIVAILSLLFTGCGKWLDIYPVEELGEEIFEKPEGYYLILNGVYLDMGDFGLYGKNLTWEDMEVWGRGYKIKDNESHKDFKSLISLEYEEKGPQALGETIWRGMYRNIARLNLLIAHAEKTTPDFFVHGDVERNVILGEAYALRAYLHFDLLRVFGQTMATEEGRNGSYLPYVTEYPSKSNPPIKSSDFIEKVKEDLAKGAEMVGTYDLEHLKEISSQTTRFSKDETPDWGEFFRSRGYRLNYYAIKIVQARVALYNQEYQNAYDFAEEVKKFMTDERMSQENNIAVNPKMLKETLFAYYNELLYDDVVNWFKDPYKNKQLLQVDQTSLFTKSGDKRNGFIKDNNNAPVIFMKDAAQETIPAIRTSEVYYIMAECLAMQEKLPEAISTLNYILGKRGAAKISNQVTHEEFMAALIEDCRKEFLCMGQNVFMYKRLNRPVITNGDEFLKTVNNLVLPKPHSESQI